jgi:hypothetical protein
LKNNFFFKILKTDDDLNYLAKFVEQFDSKTHLVASESAKTPFCDVTKVENFEKKCPTLSEKNHLNIFASADQNPR